MVSVTLDEGRVIQIDATVISGVLILLTISSFSPENLHKIPSYLDVLGGIYGATAIIIAPFAGSALVAIITKVWQENREYRRKIIPLLQNKINLLNEKISQESDKKIKIKLGKELEKLKKSIVKINKKLIEYDELKEVTECRKGKVTSLGLMALGFMYLLYIMYLIAQSGVPIHT